MQRLETRNSLAKLAELIQMTPCLRPVYPAPATHPPPLHPVILIVGDKLAPAPVGSPSPASKLTLSACQHSFALNSCSAWWGIC